MPTEQFLNLSQSTPEFVLGAFGAGGTDISRVAIPAAVLFLLAALIIRLRRPVAMAGSADTVSMQAPAPEADPAPAPARPVTGPSIRPRTSLLSDPVHQMSAITSVEFESVRLFNREGARLLQIIETAARKSGSIHRVMSQTSLGDVLRPRHGSGSMAELQDAFTSLSLRRLDFAVFDGFGQLVCAIDYEGNGKRDVVKRELLRRVGVPTIVVSREFDDADVSQKITQILSPESAESEHGHAAVHV